MFTLFHFFVLVGAFVGIGTGLFVGVKSFGIFGGILGALTGGYLGVAVGRIPEWVTLRLLIRNLNAKSTTELKTLLHGPNCLTPNVVLLELRRRGEDIRQELPFVLDLLVSEDAGGRGKGWAALTSAFPELAAQVQDYRIADSVDDCRRKLEKLRSV
ncbi:MAG: hypothetical protein KIS92_23280 [Planctomycetota bacterium]|nr:hypothetical protein [Planctomycetota bacterium]